MLKKQKFFYNHLLVFALVFVLFGILAACHQVKDTAGDIDVTAKTTMSGNVNGSPIEVDILANFNTGRGGTSNCTFTKLPDTFLPATLGTHT